MISTDEKTSLALGIPPHETLTQPQECGRLRQLVEQCLLHPEGRCSGGEFIVLLLNPAGLQLVDLIQDRPKLEIQRGDRTCKRRGEIDKCRSIPLLLGLCSSLCALSSQRWRVSAAPTAGVARVTGSGISVSAWVLESAADPNQHLIGSSRRHPAPQDTQAPPDAGLTLAGRARQHPAGRGLMVQAAGSG